MGLSKIQVLQDQVCTLRHKAYRYGFQAEEFWDRLTLIEDRLQALCGIEQDHQLLQYRVDRYLDFGEPLD